MMKRRWLTFILPVVLAAGTMICFGEVQGADKIKLRMGHVVAPGSVYDQGSKKFAELVEKKSQGRVEITVFPSGQLGQEREMMEGMPLAFVDVGVMGAASLAAVVPALDDCNLPYLFRNKEHVDKVLEGEIGQHWLKLLEVKGMKGVGWCGSGFRSSLNS